MTRENENKHKERPSKQVLSSYSRMRISIRKHSERIPDKCSVCDGRIDNEYLAVGPDDMHLGCVRDIDVTPVRPKPPLWVIMMLNGLVMAGIAFVVYFISYTFIYIMG